MVKNLVVLLILFPLLCSGQILTEETLLARLKSDGSITEDVLSKRSVVLYSHTFTPKEITNMHEGLVRAGIDAVGYFKLDGVLAGGEIASSYAEYFLKREIGFFVLMQKSSSGFSAWITAFNGKEDLVAQGQQAWFTKNVSLNETLNMIYRTALASNKKKNLLMNEVAETDLPVRIIDGERKENFAYDLKVDNLAIPTFNDAQQDTSLAQLMKTYPFRYKLTDHTIPDKDLRTKGYLYVLCFVHTRSSVAKELLGYPVSKSESAFVSVTYPNGQVQLKTIPADTPVFKFYIRHIDSGNIFLGTKWDAETTWQQALQNYIKAFRIEMKVD
jgi:hypothetical protein